MSEQPGLVHDGMYRVTWVPSIVNLAAPTVAELNHASAIQLECQITPDGLSRDASDETVDTSRLCSTFNTTQVGRTGFEVSLTLVRLDEREDDVIDEAYDTFRKGVRGFLVVRDNISADVAWAAAQVVEAYPVQCGTRSKSAPAANELQTFTIPFNVTGDPELYGTVAAA